MISRIQNQISIERVETLIEAYGGNTQCWPEQEREAAKTLLDKSPVLQQRYTEAQQLDALLLAGNDAAPLDESLLARIVNALPEQPVVPRNHWSHSWTTAMAAGLAALAIMLIVVDKPAQQAEQLALQDMDYMLWQDVTGQASEDVSEDGPVDFMNML